jgi:hypothetical protein
MVTPAIRREAVAHLQLTYKVSERRACSALGADRTSMRYRSRRPDDMAVRTRLRELASVRRRFGYRRLHILLRREGVVMNHKKLRRLWKPSSMILIRKRRAARPDQQPPPAKPRQEDLGASVLFLGAAGPPGLFSAARVRLNPIFSPCNLDSDNRPHRRMHPGIRHDERYRGESTKRDNSSRAESDRRPAGKASGTEHLSPVTYCFCRTAKTKISGASNCLAQRHPEHDPARHVPALDFAL